MPLEWAQLIYSLINIVSCLTAYTYIYTLRCSDVAKHHSHQDIQHKSYPKISWRRTKPAIHPGDLDSFQNAQPPRTRPTIRRGPQRPHRASHISRSFPLPTHIFKIRLFSLSSIILVPRRSSIGLLRTCTSTAITRAPVFASASTADTGRRGSGGGCDTSVSVWLAMAQS